LATPLGTEDQSSSSTMSDLPKPSEVDADNIIKPSLDEISADHRQVYEEYKKAREEKDLQEFLAKFKKIAKATSLRLKKSSSLLFKPSRLNPL
jgi:hypothetical protein